MSLSQSEVSYEGTVDVDEEEEEAEGFSCTFCCNLRIAIIGSVCSCHACGKVIEGGGPLHWLRRHYCNSCTSAQSTDQNDQEQPEVEQQQGPRVEQTEQPIPSISVTKPEPANEE